MHRKLAAAISSGKKILLLDKPTSSLDDIQTTRDSQALQRARSSVVMGVGTRNDAESDLQVFA